MKKQVRRMFSIVMALLIAMSLPIYALAAEYDLAAGSVVVNASEGSAQTVTHGSNAAVEDAAPVVTGTYTGDGPAITIETTGNATANVTIQDVTITPSSGSAIEIGDSNAVINVEGTNQVDGFDNPDDTYIFGADPNGAAIHINSGDVEITSSTDGVLNMTVDGGSPAIGCDGDENLTGDITISGSVELNITNNGTAASIGGAVYSDVAGDTVISDQASVSFEGSKNCIGISNVGGGVMSGNVTVEDSASVELSENGRIGSPYSGLMGEDTTFIIDGTASINGEYGSDAVDGNVKNFKHVIAEPPAPPAPPAASAAFGEICIPDHIYVPITCENVTVYATVIVNGNTVKVYNIAPDDLAALKGDISVDLTGLSVAADSLVFHLAFLKDVESIEIVFKGGTVVTSADTLAEALANATGEALRFTLSGSGDVEITNA